MICNYKIHFTSEKLHRLKTIVHNSEKKKTARFIFSMKNERL